MNLRFKKIIFSTYTKKKKYLLLIKEKWAIYKKNKKDHIKNDHGKNKKFTVKI
jgi:hypothetical protein